MENSKKNYLRDVRKSNYTEQKILMALSLMCVSMILPDLAPYLGDVGFGNAIFRSDAFVSAFFLQMETDNLFLNSGV